MGFVCLPHVGGADRLLPFPPCILLCGALKQRSSLSCTWCNAFAVQLADCLEPKKFKESETMIHCDSPPDYMYVIVEGTVKVVGRDDDGNKIDVCSCFELSV